ncbi:hypothetical protein Q8G28_17575 [Lysinibacillus capsici]|uniref:hypothetical protein n=1 Tax=Lysinibacillus capsici TaxID=2115968 RepID=UPI00272F1934|nr:hypothetical protein [Lysinibacillus capsici]MDP1395301.1 hypothetical protein [Lysinibacillus capsici]MDP1415766.1 hypothetical protein [Lysinibacillus capsici]MDP1431554.1 hypothetical protein [Lysinibacillus capsici]
MKKLFLLGVMSALFLAACGEDEAKPKEEKPVVAEAKEKGEKKEPATITIEQYESNFVDAFNELKGDSNIALGNMEKLDNGRYSLILNSDIMLFADANKKGEVTVVSLAALSSAVDNYNDLLKSAFQAMIKSVDESITDTQQTVIFDKLGITGDEKMLDHTDTYKYKDITFVYRAKNEEGTLTFQAKLD